MRDGDDDDEALDEDARLALALQIDDAVATLIHCSVTLGASVSVLVEHPMLGGSMGGVNLRDARWEQAVIGTLVMRRLNRRDHPAPDPVFLRAATAVMVWSDPPEG